MSHLAVLGSGMMTGVGLTAPSSCAAMRAAINGFTETRFMNQEGEWIVGSPVPLEQPWRGRAKLLRLVAPVIHECLAAAGGVGPEKIPLLLCVAEADRPGRLEGLDDRLLDEVQEFSGARFHSRSCTIARGRVGGAVALELARRLVVNEPVPFCLIAGVDSFLVGTTLAAYEARHRLLTAKNSNGFMPGEAGSAVLVGPPGAAGAAHLRCMGIGFGRERATVDSEEPQRADGLVEAFRAMHRDGGVTLDDADYRYTDCNGEQYGFKQDRLAYARTVRKLKARFDHLHPADSIGEVGAAVGPCVMGLALAAARKGYAPGNGVDDAPGKGVLCHFSNDDGERAAVLLRYVANGGSP